MKKILYSVMALAALTFSFSSLTSCEDVPAPYEIPGDGGDDNPSTPDVAPAGTGTQADPFNVAGALQYINNGGDENAEVYVKGKVVSVQSGSFDPSYGSLKYYISDDGTSTNQFLVYNGYAGPDRTKFTSEDALKPGDEVVICGKLVNYNGTKEFTTGNYVVSLNGNGNNPSQPGAGQATGDGTQANPYNSVAANQYASSLASGAESDKDIYVKGKVVSVKEQYGTQYGNATFYISDDGKSDNQFYVFRALYLNNEKYTSGATLNPGDEVVVCGRVTNYMGNTPETVQGKAYLVSLKSNGGGTSGGGTTGDASASNGDFENWTNGQPNNWMTTSTAGNATLSQSTDAHSGKYSVKVAGANQNKRLGYKEMTLKAGEYTMTFYAKAATDKASLRPGFVPVVDGKVGSYVYGEYTNDLTSTEWVKVTHTFKIDEDGTYCLVIMNSKTPGGDLLIDDFTLMMGSTVIIK